MLICSLISLSLNTSAFRTGVIHWGQEVKSPADEIHSWGGHPKGCKPLRDCRSSDSETCCLKSILHLLSVLNTERTRLWCVRSFFNSLHFTVFFSPSLFIKLQCQNILSLECMSAGEKNTSDSAVVPLSLFRGLWRIDACSSVLYAVQT